MICYAVIDTDVLVSALLSSKDDAATVQVMIRVLSGEIVTVYSTVMAKEYREVLLRKKFGFESGTVDVLLFAMKKFGVLVNPSPSGVVLPDASNLPFYEVVLEKRGDNAYLVTGNTKHFSKESFVVTPRELLDILKHKEH